MSIFGWFSLYAAASLCVALGFWLALLLRANQCSDTDDIYIEFSDAALEIFLLQRWMIANYFDSEKSWLRAADFIQGAALLYFAANETHRAELLNDMCKLALERATFCAPKKESA